MLIDSEQKFIALVEALRLLAADRQPGWGLTEAERADLTRLIARGWSAADAVAFVAHAGGGPALSLALASKPLALTEAPPPLWSRCIRHGVRKPVRLRHGRATVVSPPG